MLLVFWFSVPFYFAPLVLRGAEDPCHPRNHGRSLSPALLAGCLSSRAFPFHSPSLTQTRCRHTQARSSYSSITKPGVPKSTLLVVRSLRLLVSFAFKLLVPRNPIGLLDPPHRVTWFIVVVGGLSDDSCTRSPNFEIKQRDQSRPAKTPHPTRSEHPKHKRWALASSCISRPRVERFETSILRGPRARRKINSWELQLGTRPLNGRCVFDTLVSFLVHRRTRIKGSVAARRHHFHSERRAPAPAPLNSYRTHAHLDK